jgi:hypothetical protein
MNRHHPESAMSRTLVSFLPLLLACAAGTARADLAPDAPGIEKPDFALTSVSFKGKSTATHNFPITTSAAATATMKLGAATPVGMQGEACQYQMTFDAVSAGPGSYYAGNPWDGVVVGVDVKFPDGSTQTFKGNWFCEGAFKKGMDNSATEYQNASMMGAPVNLSSYSLAPGVGCAMDEPVTLAVGKTRIAWTFDPDKKVSEYSEANNKFTVDLVVNPKCETLATMAMRTPNSGPTPIPEGAMEPAQPQISMEALKAASSSSRDSLSKAFRFGGNGKVIQRSVPKSGAKPARERNP